MRSERAIPVAAVLVVAFVMAAGCLGGGDMVTFEADSMVEPEVYDVDPVTPDMPTPVTTASFPATYSLSWAISDAYAVYGGVITVMIENSGVRDLYVYGTVIDLGTECNETTMDADLMLEAGESGEVGPMTFETPMDPGTYSYRVGVMVSAENQFGLWNDKGATMSVDEYDLDVKPRVDAEDWVVHANDETYYNEVNSLVDAGAVDEAVSAIMDSVPGTYSVPQIAAAYDWVFDNIAYESDIVDEWQSAAETMELRTGDCEDHAILMSSIITALGGDARVNIIKSHAFATVFVTDDVDELQAIEDSLSSYYGTDLHACFLEDDLGYWLVIDTTGRTYAGGLTPNSAPTVDGGDSWTFTDTSYLYTIDVTGEVYDPGVLDLL